MAEAQYFWNTDFEYGVYKEQPRKWAIEGEGESYMAFLDSTVSKMGAKSLFMELKNAETYTILGIPGAIVRGKTLSVKGHLKLKEVNSLKTKWMYFNPETGNIIASSVIEPDSKKWQKTSIEAAIPEDYSPDNLLLVLTAQGSGSFWVDNLELKIDGKVYGDDEPDFKAPTEREIQLLNEKAIPFEFGQLELDNAILKSLSSIIKDASIVALGENSHGSSSIYKLKLELIKYLVKEEAFSVFALEMPTVEADYINAYVLKGEGSLSKVIDKLTYPSWQTKEMIEIIEWIKAYNLQANQKVEFRGFDMQDGRAALTNIKAFAEEINDELSVRIREIENLYKESFETGKLSNSLFEKAQHVEQSINYDNYPEFKESTIVKINHYMNIFIQSLAYNFQIKSAKRRDEYMAENISWILKNSGEKTRIIISGDNTHITKTGGKMGTMLSTRYKEKYISIGFTYNKGTYSAYGPKEFYEVHPSYIGTYEYYFSESNYQNFLLDLRDVAEIPILNKKNGFRSIGSRPQETTQFYEINIKDHFDAVIYMEKSKHTQPLKK